MYVCPWLPMYALHRKLTAPMPDPEMIIRICDVCKQPRVLQHYQMEASEGNGPFVPWHAMSAECECGPSEINDLDRAARPELFGLNDDPQTGV